MTLKGYAGWHCSGVVCWYHSNCRIKWGCWDFVFKAVLVDLFSPITATKTFSRLFVLGIEFVYSYRINLKVGSLIS